jgi:hypothetical protein
MISPSADGCNAMLDRIPLALLDRKTNVFRLGLRREQRLKEGQEFLSWHFGCSLDREV